MCIRDSSIPLHMHCQTCLFVVDFLFPYPLFGSLRYYCINFCLLTCDSRVALSSCRVGYKPSCRVTMLLLNLSTGLLNPHLCCRITSQSIIVLKFNRKVFLSTTECKFTKLVCNNNP